MGWCSWYGSYVLVILVPSVFATGLWFTIGILNRAHLQLNSNAFGKLSCLVHPKQDVRLEPADETCGMMQAVGPEIALKDAIEIITCAFRSTLSWAWKILAPASFYLWIWVLGLIFSICLMFLWQWALHSYIRDMQDVIRQLRQAQEETDVDVPEEPNFDACTWDSIKFLLCCKRRRCKEVRAEPQRHEHWWSEPREETIGLEAFLCIPTPFVMVLYALSFACFFAMLPPMMVMVLVSISSVSIPLCLVFAIIAFPFLVDKLDAVGSCNFNRAVLFCLPVLGSNEAIPVNYYVLPAYCLKWAWHLRGFFNEFAGRPAADQECKDMSTSLGRGTATREEGEGSSWATQKIHTVKNTMSWPMEIVFQLLDVKSDVSVALSSWKVLPPIWSALFAPTVLLSCCSLYLVAFHKPAFVKRDVFWLKLQLWEDVSQSILALVGIFLYARAGAPQDPFIVTTVADSMLRCVLQLVLFRKKHAEAHLLVPTSETRGLLKATCDLFFCEESLQPARRCTIVSI